MTNHYKKRGVLHINSINIGVLRIRVAGKKTVRVSFLAMIGQP